MPVAAELPVVAPVIVHVSFATEQLSAVAALVMATSTVQSPVPSADVVVTTSVAAVTVGFSSSVTVTVNEQVASGEQELCAVIVTLVTPLLKVEPLPVPDVVATI